MADYGIDDIFIAYPLIGEDKMERLGRLMQRIRVSTEVNSIYGAKQLSALGERIGKKVACSYRDRRWTAPRWCPALRGSRRLCGLIVICPVSKSAA